MSRRWLPLCLVLGLLCRGGAARAAPPQPPALPEVGKIGAGLVTFCLDIAKDGKRDDKKRGSKDQTLPTGCTGSVESLCDPQSDRGLPLACQTGLAGYAPAGRGAEPGASSSFDLAGAGSWLFSRALAEFKAWLQDRTVDDLCPALGTGQEHVLRKTCEALRSAPSRRYKEIGEVQDEIQDDLAVLPGRIVAHLKDRQGPWACLGEAPNKSEPQSTRLGAAVEKLLEPLSSPGGLAPSVKEALGTLLPFPGREVSGPCAEQRGFLDLIAAYDALSQSLESHPEEAGRVRALFVRAEAAVRAELEGPLYALGPPAQRLSVLRRRLGDTTRLPSPEETINFTRTSMEVLTALLLPLRPAQVKPVKKAGQDGVAATCVEDGSDDPAPPDPGKGLRRLSQALLALGRRDYVSAVLHLLDDDLGAPRNLDGKLPEGALQSLRKHARLVGGIAAARSSDDITRALDTMEPQRGYRAFRERGGAIFLGAHVGLLFGPETALQGGGGAGLALGLSLPVGIELGWPLPGCGATLPGCGASQRLCSSFNLLLSPVDLGGLASVRISGTDAGKSGAADSAAPLSFASLLAPGVFATFGLAQTPLVLGLGVQVPPAGRSYFVCEGAAERCDKTQTLASLRVGVFLGMDLPLFRLSK